MIPHNDLRIISFMTLPYRPLHQDRRGGVSSSGNRSFPSSPATTRTEIAEAGSQMAGHENRTARRQNRQTI